MRSNVVRPSRPLHTGRRGSLAYLLSRPERAAGAQPLLVFLHGYDEGAPMELTSALTRHGPLRPDHDVAELDEFIIIAPQLPVRGDVWSRYGADVLDIAQYAVSELGADARRMYLTGFSFGGNGVFDLALLQVDVWAALWAVDPTRVPMGDPRRPVWVSIGEVARRHTAQFVQALGLRAAGSGPPPDHAYLDQGADHVGSATLAYGDARIYQWLSSKQT